MPIFCCFCMSKSSQQNFCCRAALTIRSKENLLRLLALLGIAVCLLILKFVLSLRCFPFVLENDLVVGTTGALEDFMLIPVNDAHGVHRSDELHLNQLELGLLDDTAPADRRVARDLEELTPWVTFGWANDNFCPGRLRSHRGQNKVMGNRFQQNWRISASLVMQEHVLPNHLHDGPLVGSQKGSH